MTPAGAERWPRLRMASDLSWRFLVVAGALAAVGFVLVQVRLVVLPLFVALLLATVLVPAVVALERRGLRPAMATWIVFLAFLGIAAAIIAVVIPRLADEFAGLSTIVSNGVDELEDWLVEGPLDVSREDLDRYRSEASERIGEYLRSSAGVLLGGAVLVLEIFAGALLALVLSFFVIKDGRRFQAWTLRWLDQRHHDTVRATASRVWRVLTGFVRGAALIGTVEAVIIGTTLALVGGGAVIPVMVLTFLAAFFPIVGAIVAGIVAVLVALVSGGVGDAIIVGIVALVVQQLDNDLLAPLLYGRAVKLHPALVLMALAAGGTVAGIAGAFVAVPLTAAVAAVVTELANRWYGLRGWDSNPQPSA